MCTFVIIFEDVLITFIVILVNSKNWQPGVAVSTLVTISKVAPQ